MYKIKEQYSGKKGEIDDIYFIIQDYHKKRIKSIFYIDHFVYYYIIKIHMSSYFKNVSIC